MNTLDFIYLDWPAPVHVKALTTTRHGGFSVGPYTSLNFSNRVGDEPGSVRRNRGLLREALKLPVEPLWLSQVHGNRVIDAFDAGPGEEADGCVTGTPGVVCAVLTADCLPIFLCDRRSTRIGLIHAGWRGLAAGIIEEGLRRIHVPTGNLLAYLGPAIGPSAYEVGDEVRQAFVSHNSDDAESFTAVPNRPGHWLADLYDLARRRLRSQGVHEIYGGLRCTFRERELFFSHRRDGTCGRMVSLIWLDKTAR
ncbi:MAG: peptidoglycan editing factor PgeF [Gammaproteobacteria bacterium]|nr:peptidoglycan editing factor PgeF [Gammaproteobacteria bacterium]